MNKANSQTISFIGTILVARTGVEPASLHIPIYQYL